MSELRHAITAFELVEPAGYKCRCTCGWMSRGNLPVVGWVVRNHLALNERARP